MTRHSPRIVLQLSLPVVLVLSAALSMAPGCGKSQGSTGGAGGAGGGTPLTGTAERGKYLVDAVLNCGQCHTPSDANGVPDSTKYLAGSRSYDFKTDTGEVVSVYAENITDHAEQGVGTWTNDQVRTAIKGGTDDVNIAMWPIMPYPEYALMTADDVDSIVRYLRTVAPSDNVVPSDTLADPYPPASAIVDSQIPQTTLAATDPKYASAQRGRYLAAIGCANCHTPELSPGNPDFTKAFAGGRTYVSRSDLAPSTSTNLTPAVSGLKGATVDQIVQSMKANTSVLASTALCNTAPHQMSKFTDADLQDVAEYVHSLPAIESGPFKCQGP